MRLIIGGGRLDELVSDFIAETREGLETLDSELVRFEKNPGDPEVLGGVFRLIHTIKGTCGFLGLMRLQTVAHAAENVLGEFRDGSLAVTPAAVSAILDTVDLIRDLVDGLARTGVEPAGDDSALITRLETVLAGASADDAASAVPAPAALEAAADSRPLIQRLGGEATLDAAVESALSRLHAWPAVNAAFLSVDPDRLQGELRDCLTGGASGSAAAVSLSATVQAMVGAPVEAETLAGLMDIVILCLAELDIDDRTLADLAAVFADETAPAMEDVVAAVEIPTPPSPSAGIAAPAAAAPAAPRTKTLTPEASDVELAGPAQTIRVSVDALEHLMTVASELVLIRNQLIQVLRLDPESPFAAPLNRLNQVTTELQEGVMTTRMQPISGAWAKLPRLVRDLAQDLGKSIELSMHGQETELDRQVLELIKDPLTHMIRNAADHGIETPRDRLAAGKAEAGRITLQARHEGGAIVIEVMDDGRGLSATKLRAKGVSQGLITAAQAEAMSDSEARHLIFRPGFSTAPEVTAVSGRGVGMDVVRTNIERIGGAIEMTSTEGAGTRFTIRIPLTLTIVSALIVECCGERFAMPQSCVIELVSASDGSGRVVEYVDDAAVLRLRDRLLPLVSLGTLLGLPANAEVTGESCIVVAQVGAFTFGVIVDRVFDTEEIVVKPVASVLRHLKLYSGATILGDGSVILILDFKGISQEAGAQQSADGARDELEMAASGSVERTALLTFHAGDATPRAVPLSRVARIEELLSHQIETVEGRTVIQYRGGLMPVVNVDGRPVQPWSGETTRPLLVFARGEQAVGLLVDEIVDIVEDEPAKVGDPDAAGLIVAGRATEMVDIDRYWGDAPAATARTAPASTKAPVAGLRRLLLIDDSPFSRLLLQPLLAQSGYDVIVAEGAVEALTLYEAGEQFDLIMAETDPQGEEARRFAQAFGKATRWHATPLMGLSLQGRDRGAARFDGSRLLDAVNSAFNTRQAA
ncbi:MAG: hybrid sensor histidine kinase/response regulator [Caulobacteraceae bacterium]|nr:hybrid sensor histidine kinase/response regulator [Caulobacteraceae bacterium]